MKHSQVEYPPQITACINLLFCDDESDSDSDDPHNDPDGRLDVDDESENLVTDGCVSQLVWSEIINNFDMNMFAGTTSAVPPIYIAVEETVQTQTDCDFDLTEILSQFSHGVRENSCVYLAYLLGLAVIFSHY